MPFDDDGPTFDDQMLVRRLRQAAPAAPAIDAVQIAFEAGRRSGARTLRRWQTGAGLSLMAVAVLATWPRPTILDRRETAVPAIAAKPVTLHPSGPYATSGGGPATVLALRDAILDGGLDALPQRPTNSTHGVIAADGSWKGDAS